ncbi:MAG: hypothetical protein FWE42_08450, partial [Defluviitaleaceae bacterium]|nr:hypothetical protein [Defluviitaleaceae bacterium]
MKTNTKIFTSIAAIALVICGIYLLAFHVTPGEALISYEYEDDTQATPPPPPTPHHPPKHPHPHPPHQKLNKSITHPPAP